MDFACPFCEAALDAAAVDAGDCTHCNRSLTVLEQFRLKQMLGQGGMGTVYEATGPSDERVAVKVLRIEGDPKDKERWSLWEMFERSCRVLEGLEHTALPRVFAFGKAEPARLVLVREIFDGGTLAERIEAARRLEPEQMLRFTKTLLELLVYLHGIVPPVIHRDIKPQNIMFRTADDWNPVLVDFDTVAAPEAERTGLTIVGTVGYAAPELLAGEATPGTDIYALGVSLLHLATRTAPDRLPHTHGRFQVDGLIDELTPELGNVLRKMIEPDPERRYSEATEAISDLTPRRTAENDEGQEEKRPLDKEDLKAIVIVAALLLFVGWMLFPDGDDSDVPSSVQREIEACNRGAAGKCRHLGAHYEHGEHGLPKDEARAVELYRKACDGKDARGCVFLGDMLAWGKGAVVDEKGATTAYEDACRLGHTRACQYSCARYKNGTGVNVDLVKARALCEMSCDKGDSHGCNDLALFHRDGLGIPVDAERAESLFAKACKDGDGLACHNQAQLVGSQDGERAHALEQDACEKKNKAGCDAAKKKIWLQDR